jgi:uncharacterized protein YfaP (DUF2135 family)
MTGPLAIALAAAAALLPRVTIETPTPGWTTERLVKVTGSVEPASIGRATLVVNGAAKGLAVENGRFSSDLVLGPGENVVSVIAENEAGAGSDALAVTAEAPPVDVKVVLTWDTDKTDVDLHVVDPSGEEVNYTHRESKLGGKLDNDVTTGFGPETFTLANAIPGDYQIRAKYYSDHGQPVTMATVQVILFEGTDREERHRYDGMLLKTGEFFQVGSFHVAAK